MWLHDDYPEVLNELKYEVVLSGNGKPIKIEATGKKTISQTVPTGTYRLEMKVWRGDDGPNQSKYASGKVNKVVIKRGNNPPVNVPMKPACDDCANFLCECLSGSAEITGTYRIGETLTVNTSGITGSSNFNFYWRADNETISGATNVDYVIKGADAGKVISCFITSNDTGGIITAFGEKIPYNVVLIEQGNHEHEENSVELSAGYGHVGDIITVSYVLGNISARNILTFSGGLTDVIELAGADDLTYTVNASHAEDGEIRINAHFLNTALEYVSIAFNNTASAMSVTYGNNGNSLTNAIAAGHPGSGAVTYSSSNTTVATVDNFGVVTILRAGSVTITAEKAADLIYAPATRSYNLTISQRQLTIASATHTRQYDGTIGTNTPAITGLTLSGIIGSDTASINSYTAVYANASAGTRTLDFTNVSLTGANAGNYTVPNQAVAMSTGGITQRTLTFSTFTVASPNNIPTITGTTLSPINLTTNINVAISGLIGNDSVAITTNVTGITLGGANISGTATVARPLTYNGTTEFATPSQTVTFTANAGSNYTSPAQTLTINVRDGHPAANTGTAIAFDSINANRRIPVTQENINLFNTYANSTAGRNRHYFLTQNITLDLPAAGQSNWTAIGSSIYFYGSFDGEDRTITNLTIERPNDNYQGLFGILFAGSMVRRVGLLNVRVNGNFYVGGIAGQNGIPGQTGGGTIERVYTEGSRGITGHACVGGILGQQNFGTVRYSYSRVNISGRGVSTTQSHNIGGVVGDNNGTIENCYSTGNITGTTDIGGVTGINHSGTVRNCYAIGNVTGSAFASILAIGVGGIAGRNHGLLEYCWASGAVSGFEHVGGITGSIYNTNSRTIYCIALNSRVTATTTVVNPFVGRIVSDASQGTLENNRGRADMGGSNTNFTGGTLANKNGLSAAINAQLPTAVFVGWNTTHWSNAVANTVPGTITGQLIVGSAMPRLLNMPGTAHNPTLPQP